MIRAALYARVSTDQQAREGDSIPAQREAIRTYIDNHDDMILAGEYIDDGVSGTKADRDELQRLLEDVKQNKVDLILFTKLDRWFRSVRHYAFTQEILDAHNVQWTAIWEPIYSTASPQSALVVNMMMSIAQFEAQNTSSRIKQVFDYKVSQGEAISGSVPLGYSIINKRLVPNEEAYIVADLFRHYNEHNNLSELGRYAARNYGIYRARPVFKRMLMNKRYIGQNRDNEAFCEPIVDRELFDSVQRKIGMNIKKGRKHEYIFSGMLKCDVCGHAYTSAMDRKGIHLYPKYRCDQHFAHKTCPNYIGIYERRLEEYLVDNVRELLRGRELEYKIEQKKQEKQKGNIRKLEQKRDRLKELYLNELITLDEYKRDRAEIDAEIASQGAEKPVPPLTHIELPKDFETLYKGFSVREKRYLWQGVVKEIRVHADGDLEIIFL